MPQELAISVITIGELRAGVLAAQDTETRDKRLNTLQAALSVEAIPITVAVAAAWARLRLVLRENGRRMPVNDSWIAATAISFGHTGRHAGPGPPASRRPRGYNRLRESMRRASGSEYRSVLPD